MKKSIILLILTLIFGDIANCQSFNRDSLLNQFSVLSDDTNKIMCLRQLVLYYHSRDIDSMLYYANQMEELSKKLDYSRGQISAMNFKGIVYDEKGDLEKSLSCYQFSYDLSEKTGYKKGADIAFNNITSNLLKLKQYDKALANYNKLVKEFTLSHDTNNLVYPLMNIAIIYSETNKISQAHIYNDKALKIAKYIKNDKAIVTILMNKANGYVSEEKSVEAEKYYTQALKICEEKGLVREAEKVKLNMAALSSIKGEHEEAINVMKDILIKFPKGFSHYHTRMDTYIALINEYEKLKKYDSAYKYLKEYHEINKKIYSDTIASLVNEFNIKYETGLKKKKIELLEKENQVKELSFKKSQQRKNFAYVSIAAILIFGGYGFYHFRKNKKLENHQSLLNERLRISRELHDDMGSTLSSISVYSEVAKNRASKNENEMEVLQKIGTASRELIEKMSDIVWSLNPNNENFEQLKNRMMAFAAMMLAPKGILFEFDIDDEVKSTSIAPEQRKNIFLIYKEAINNIVKYSEASSVKVKVKVKENKLSLEVIDNGKGFDTRNIVAYNGNGLKNMRARAEEIKALFNVTSRINEGTGIELSFNL